LEVGHRKRLGLLLLWWRRRRWWWMVPVMSLLPLRPWPLFPFFETLLKRVVPRYQGRYRFRRVGRIRDGWLLRRFRRARHHYRLGRTLSARGRADRGCPRRRSGRRGGGGRRRGRGNDCRCGRQRAHRPRDRRYLLVKVIGCPGTLSFILVTLH